MFWPIGAAVFHRSSGPNHTPSPAWAFTSLFLLQDPSVYTTMSLGFVLAASLVAWVLDLLYVLLRILKFSCMSLVEVILGLKNFTLLGFLIVYLLATSVSSWVGSLFVGGCHNQFPWIRKGTQVRLGPASRPGPQPPGVQLRWRMVHGGIIGEILAKGRKLP